MKKALYITVIFICIGVMVFGSIYIKKKSVEDAYGYAVTLIKNGSYEGALTELEKANPDIIIDRDDFEWDVRRGNLKECYQNTVYLYAYAMAQLEYNLETGYMAVIHDYLELIPAEYSGELCEEITAFKEKFNPQYEEYLEEEKRKAEAARIEQQKREQEYIASLSNKIPYEGMSETYINLTAAGKAEKHNSEYVKGWGSEPGYNYDKYLWYADNSNDIVLIVECKDGKVTDVIKYFEWVYWTSDGMPKFWATKPKTTTKSSSSKKKEDPYNVNDYSDPEDFYYDNYDDFWEYEEAEDYFNEHHD